jgi:hypothetical protein
MSIFNDIMQGVGDLTRAGVTDAQNHFAQSVWGQPAPTTSPTADMVYTSNPQEAEPQSLDGALRTHSDMEQAEIRASYEAGQGAAPAIDASPQPSSTPAPEAPVVEPEM